MSPSLSFILCPSYQGATLLALLLNNHTEITCLGDTIPTRAYDQTCACRKLVSQCSFWQEIERILNTARFYDSEFLLPYYPRGYKTSKLIWLFNGVLWIPRLYLTPGVWKLIGIAADEYLQVHLDFYKTVCDIQETSVFVDGQKSVTKVLMLKTLLGKKVKMKVLHLVRDPRGFFNSCKKYLHNITVEETANTWVKSHRRIESLRQPFFDYDYLFLRYEDLCQDPSKVMKQAFEFFGVENQEVCKPPANPEKHHLMGNKMLFEFDGTIKLDSAWRELLSREEQSKCIELTRPLSSRFGYAGDL